MSAFGDEDVVVLGFDMGDAPIGAGEQSRANGIVDQAVGPGDGHARRGERDHDESRGGAAARQRQQS